MLPVHETEVIPELAKIAHSIEKFCEQVESGLSGATFEQRRSLVELLIDRVVVTDEEVEIRYVGPTTPEGPHHPFCYLRTDYLGSLPGREVVRQEPPGAAAPHYVEDGIHQLAGSMYSWASATFGFRNERF